MTRFVIPVLVLSLVGVSSGGKQDQLRLYVVDQGESSLFIVTHKAGLLSFLGHEHAIVPREWSAELCLAEPIPRLARGTIVIQATSLVIDTDSARALAGLGGGPGRDDVLEIQAKMLDAKHLDVRTYPQIVLEIDSVARESSVELVAFGRFTLHGVTRDVSVPMRFESSKEGTIRLTGALRIRQRDFEIEPESTAAVVKVSNDVDLHFTLVAAATDRPCPQ